MMNKNTLPLAAAMLAAVLIASGAAHAASLSLIYSGDNDIAADGAILVNDGDLLTFTVYGDFTGPDERTLGGGYDIEFDAQRLTVSEYMTECGESDFCRDPVFFEGLIQDLGLGAFNGFTEFDGAVMTFEYTAAGFALDTILTTAQSTNELPGPFFISALDFVSPIDVDYQGVVLREVPLPAAGWLLLTGLLWMFGLQRDWRRTR